METPAFAPAARRMEAAQAVPMVHEKVRTRRRHHRRVSTLIMIACIVVAVMTVLFVPMLLGGAAAAPAATTENTPAVTQVQSVGTLAEATQLLGYDVTLPAILPDEYAPVAINVVDGKVLEMEYTAPGKQTILYRTAPGSDDLTWDETEYGFTVTEDVGGVTRSYAGVAEQKLSFALWADGAYSYALVAPQGVDSETLHQMAESIY